jgi:hypothetical protein
MLAARMLTQTNLRSLRPGASRQARARARWREAARLVSTRWEVFLAAEPERRGFAFASYVAALDDEERAAAAMAGRLLSRET